MTIQEQYEFKQKYTEQLKKKKRKLFLTQGERDRHDLWAKNVLGDVDYAFMFEVLIPNAKFAITNGYDVAVFEE